MWVNDPRCLTTGTTSDSFAGAFPLATGTKDAAMLVTLEPGAYTVLVGAQGTAGGEALVEVYEVN